MPRRRRRVVPWVFCFLENCWALFCGREIFLSKKDTSKYKMGTSMKISIYVNHPPTKKKVKNYLILKLLIRFVH
jgi:hypothetical protein